MKAKVLLSLSTVFFVFVWTSFSSQYDCDKIDSNNKSSDSEQISILSKDLVEQAYKNLRWYCCRSYAYSTKNCNEDKWEMGMDSAYLYEHLVDLWFRKLDWIESVSYNIELYWTWLEWREKINELATDTEGNSWNDVIELFHEYRWKNANIYADDKLPSKYLQVCEEAMIIADDIWISSSEDLRISSFYNSCTQLASARVQREIAMVQNIAIKQAWKQQSKNISNYSYNYFAKNRLMGLLEWFGRFQWLFNSVSKKVTEWTAQCNT